MRCTEVVPEANAGVRATALSLASFSARALRVASPDFRTSAPLTAIRGIPMRPPVMVLHVPPLRLDPLSPMLQPTAEPVSSAVELVVSNVNGIRF